jgi:deoxycytidylate deaminase
MKIRFFELAKKLVKHSDHHQHNIGSVIVLKNKVVSVGYNILKTHRHSPHPFKSSHSEFRAIWGTDPVELRGAEIYVYRQKKNGELGLARPCESCYSLIKSVGIKKIHYTDYDGYKTEKV